MVNRIFHALLIGAMLLAVYAAASWNPDAITLDNAYVSGRVLRITASTDGVIESYFVRRADPVVQGQRLVFIRSGENEARLREYGAALRMVVEEEMRSCKGLSAVLQRARVQLAIAKLQGAFHQASASEVAAPYDGYVYDLLAYPGRPVKKGEDLLVLIPKEPPRVEANVLESDIARLAPGTAVEVIPDTGGGKLRYPGLIQSVVPAVAAVFSPLPRNNLDSNWIRTTQRIPVLISFTMPPGDAQLPLGASVRVVIDAKVPRQKPQAPDQPQAAPAPAPTPPPPPKDSAKTAFDDYLGSMLAPYPSAGQGGGTRCR